MKTMKKIVVLAVCLSFALAEFSYAQKTINNYKYVIVPVKYDFLKTEDQYLLNSLTKFLLEKEGFTAFLENEQWPEDLKNDICNALYIDVSDDNKLFKTKLQFDLKDCTKQKVFTSEVGESRNKDYKGAYHESLRNAFKSLTAINYAYSPTDNSKTTLKETTAPQVVAVTEAKPEKVITKEATTPPVVPITPEVVAVTGAKPEKVSSKDPYLKATETAYGFLVTENNSGKELFQLMASGKENVFLVKGQNAIVYKTNTGFWKKESIAEDKLIVESLDLRF